jgi:hypothetical protein
MGTQFGRKLGLILFNGDEALDLSSFRVKFRIQNADVESPNTAVITVYNLKPSTVRKIRGEFQFVSLNAGYESGNYGVVFQGTIKQFVIGRESATDTFLEIRAADGDVLYNQGFVNQTLAAGHTPNDAITKVVEAMGGGTPNLSALTIDKQHVPNIRGSVLFGLARSKLRNLASTLDAGWSIQNGKVIFTDNTGYQAGEAVVINVNTGLIGLPEQTPEGVKLRCLLNSRLRIGGLVQLNNAEIIQLVQQNPEMAPIPFNQWAGIQYNAALAEAIVNDTDGYYRAYVVEHEGDSRGEAWHSNLVALAVNISQPANKSVGSL